MHLLISTLTACTLNGLILALIALAGNIIGLFFGSPWSWILMLVMFTIGFIYRFLKSLYIAIKTVATGKDKEIDPWNMSPAKYRNKK